MGDVFSLFWVVGDRAGDRGGTCLGKSLVMCTMRGPRGLQAFMCCTASRSCGPVYVLSTCAQGLLLGFGVSSGFGIQVSSASRTCNQGLFKGFVTCRGVLVLE